MPAHKKRDNTKRIILTDDLPLLVQHVSCGVPPYKLYEGLFFQG